MGLLFLSLSVALGIYGFLIVRLMWEDKIVSPFHFKVVVRGYSVGIYVKPSLLYVLGVLQCGGDGCHRCYRDHIRHS